MKDKKIIDPKKLSHDCYALANELGVESIEEFINMLVEYTLAHGLGARAMAKLIKSFPK